MRLMLYAGSMKIKESESCLFQKMWLNNSRNFQAEFEGTLLESRVQSSLPKDVTQNVKFQTDQSYCFFS